MTRNFISLILAVAIIPSGGFSQISFSGQTAAEFLKSSPAKSQRTYNWGRSSFRWESNLFVDGEISEHATAFLTIRTTQERAFNIDFAAIRLMDLTPLHLNFQAGRFDLPFGNLGERRYPRRNFLYGLPLIYEYETSLPDRPATDQEILAARGNGGGMPLLDEGLYDVGAMLFGTWGPVDYAFAAIGGTVSSTTYATGNTNSDIGIVTRVSVTPATGFIIGAAYAQGAYMGEYSQPAPWGVDVNNYRQQAAELDIEFSRGHAVFYGEAVLSRWPVPLPAGDQNLDLFGYYVEGKYTVIPRLYVAARVSGLRFGKATLRGLRQAWDYDVTEFEGGLGYFIDRDVLFKVVRRETRTYGGTHPKDGLTVFELAVAY